jgi:hypothetical protein
MGAELFIITEEYAMFNNGCSLAQQAAAGRLSDRIEHGNLVRVDVCEKEKDDAVV